MENTYSLADIATATGARDGMFGGNDSLAWLIIILLFANGGGIYGNNGLYGRTATVEDVNNSANFTRLEDQLRGISYGIADSAFSLNNSILTEGRAIQTQLSQCCCDNKIMTLENRYLAAQNTAEINANTTAQTQKILDKLCQNEIDGLRSKVSALELQAAVANTVKYPTTTAYCSGTNPFGCGCGCGTGYGNI